MRRALIVDPAFIGDVVFDGPLARALVGAGFEVGIVVRPPADVIAHRMTHVTHVHVFDKRGADSGWSGLSRVARSIAGGHYEVAYVPHPSVRSTLLAARARIGKRVGSAPSAFAKMALTDRIVPSPGGTFVSDRLALFDAAADPALGGVLTRRTPRSRAARPRIGLVLGSEWATKRWPPDRAAGLVDALASGADWVWLGAPWETALFSGFADRGEDRTGGDLAALVDAIESCDVVVGGDTGPVHIARALEIPVVALFGPTSEVRHTFAVADEVMTKVLACRPCSAHGQDVCPLGHHECLVTMAGTEVADAVVRVLRGGSRP